MAGLDIQKMVHDRTVKAYISQGYTAAQADSIYAAKQDSLAHKNTAPAAKKAPSPNSVMVAAKPTPVAPVAKPVPAVTEKPAVTNAPTAAQTPEAPVQIRNTPQEMMKERIIQSLMAKGLSREQALEKYASKEKSFVSTQPPAATTTPVLITTQVDTSKTVKPTTPKVVPTVKTVQAPPNVELPTPTTKTDNTRTVTPKQEKPIVAPVNTVKIAAPTAPPISTPTPAMPKIVAPNVNEEPVRADVVKLETTDDSAAKRRAMFGSSRSSQIVAPTATAINITAPTEVKINCANKDNCLNDSDGRSNTGPKITTTAIRTGGALIETEHRDDFQSSGNAASSSGVTVKVDNRTAEQVIADYAKEESKKAKK